MTAALKSVKGVTVITEPKPATGNRAATVAVIQAPDASTLKALKAAIEAANTPHKGQNAPTIILAAEGSTDAATPMAVRQAITAGKLKRVEL